MYRSSGTARMVTAQDADLSQTSRESELMVNGGILIIHLCALYDNRCAQLLTITHIILFAHFHKISQESRII